jgi:hypothetical protein
MTKERKDEILNSNTYIEEEYTGSKTGKSLLMSSAFGKCEVINRKEVKDQKEDNECFEECDNIKESKYKFYVDTEAFEYYACLK